MLKITIEKNGFFKVTGKLPQKNIAEYNFITLIKSLLLEFEVLHQTYATYLRNDNRIIGQEKADLEYHLDKLMFLLVSIRLYIEIVYFNNHIVDIYHTDENFSLRIAMLESDYSLTGEVSKELFLKISSFNDWFTNQLTPNFEKLMNLFVTCYEDRKLVTSEVKSICKQLDSLLHLLIIIIFYIEHKNYSV